MKLRPEEEVIFHSLNGRLSPDDQLTKDNLSRKLVLKRRLWRLSNNPTDRARTIISWMNPIDYNDWVWRGTNKLVVYEDLESRIRDKDAFMKVIEENKRNRIIEPITWKPTMKTPPTRVHRYELTAPRTRRTFNKMFPKEFNNSRYGDRVYMTYGDIVENYYYTENGWVSEYQLHEWWHFDMFYYMKYTIQEFGKELADTMLASQFGRDALDRYYDDDIKQKCIKARRLQINKEDWKKEPKLEKKLRLAEMHMESKR